MPLHPVYGHDDLKARLAASMAAGLLPPALLLTGAPGVGKQRLGLWIGQGLVCEKGPGQPCEACQACRMAAGLSHPDLHWFFPITRPKGDESRQVDEAMDALAAAIAVRREQPLYSRPDGMTGLFLPLVRALHRRAQMRPAMARRKVFLIAEAERLVPQASSPEAANAMLKVLEEPPPDTYFILTASEPTGLLPTIRSRLVQLRVKRLASSLVARFLEEVPVPPVNSAEARRRAELSGGSIGAALALSRESDEARTAGANLLNAASKGRSARYRHALSIAPFGGRGGFTDTLDAAAELLRDELEALLRSKERAAEGGRATSLTRAIREVEEARRLAQKNINPQLLAVDLMRRLKEAGR